MEFQTTFNQDFIIAEHFGLDAVEDTFKRCFNEWKSNYIYLTELVIVTNLRCWHHYENNNDILSQMYSDMYYKAREYALDNLKGEEFEYYYRMTD